MLMFRVISEVPGLFVCWIDSIGGLGWSIMRMVDPKVFHVPGTMFPLWNGSSARVISIPWPDGPGEDVTPLLKSSTGQE